MWNVLLDQIFNEATWEISTQNVDQQRSNMSSHNPVDLQSMYYDQSSYYQPYPGAGPYNQFNNPNMFNSSE